MKKKISRILGTMVIMFCLTMSFAFVSLAETPESEVDPEITVTQETDKDDYKETDNIKVTLTVVNTNEHESELKNVTLSVEAPKGYTTEKGTNEKKIALLEGENETTLTTTFIPVASPETGDSNDVLLFTFIFIISATIIMFLLSSKSARKMLLPIILGCIVLGGTLYVTCGNVFAETTLNNIPTESTIKVDDKEITINGLVTYSERTPEKYDVTFDLNYEGCSEGEIIKQTNGDTYKLPENNPTREGFIFAGWFIEKTEGTKITSETIVNLDNEQTLYAHWSSIAKGKLIKLDQGSEGAPEYAFRVLKIDGNKVEVLAMSGVKMAYNNDPNNHIKDNIQNYSGSDLDIYFNDVYYNALSTLIKNAIVEKDIVQGVYGTSTTKPESGNYWEGEKGFSVKNNYWIKKLNISNKIGLRYVYALGVEDVIDYLGQENLTGPNVNKMFFDSNAWVDSRCCWLNSARDPSDTYKDNVWYITSTYGLLNPYGANQTYEARASFVIDLSKCPWESVEE